MDVMNTAIVAATAATTIYHRLPVSSILCSFIAHSITRYPNELSQRSYVSFRHLSSCNSEAVTMGDALAENSSVGTCYRVSCSKDKPIKKWISVCFAETDDTTLEKSTPKSKKQKVASPCIHQMPRETASQTIPESVLQYERQMRKLRAADRASKTNVNVQDHLHVVHVDDDVVVTNKPSGILCVPGVNKHKSLLDLVYEVYGNTNEDSSEQLSKVAEQLLPRDSMIAHRLDMDTSGIVIFARTRLAMQKLHESFRERTGTKKVYEALLVGWLDVDEWIHVAKGSAECSDVMKESSEANNHSKEKQENGMAKSLGAGEINLPLQRDHKHPPFMRVSTPESEAEARLAVKDLNHAGYKKLVAKKPKASTTLFDVLSHEKWMGHPVTRVKLTPITGRTHQLRVHCAALGHPILGDPAYGFCGEAHPNGGFSDKVLGIMSPTSASFELRRDVEEAVQKSGRTMCLHARMLSIDHPVTGDPMTFEAVPSF